MKKKFPSLDPCGQGSQNGEGNVTNLMPIAGNVDKELVEGEKGAEKTVITAEAMAETMEFKIGFLGQNQFHPIKSELGKQGPGRVTS
ncbi:hypothetical protein C2S51_021380 [Perilla frutescens var. frutescens]|nr:hypothetical protein C2S51_021380 [Perilla frutescens var. frutescens]